MFQTHAKTKTEIRNQRDSKPDRKVSQTFWAAEQDETDSSIAREKRLHLIRQVGDFSLAYSTAVQPCLDYFGDDHGYIAYRRRWGSTFALGDIVAPEATCDSLLDRFLEQHPRAMFCQVQRHTAERLQERGFLINEIGIDSTLHLPTYNFKGKEKEWLRYASNWSARRDYKIVENQFNLDANLIDEVEAVSEAWRTTRTVKRKEVRFLNRPIVLEDEADVRKFFYYSPEGKLLAFVFLDPIYRDGNLVGFVTSIKRRHPDAPIYSEQAIMKHAIEALQQEGVELIKLGLSPLADIEDTHFRKSWLMHKLFAYSFDSTFVNKFFYHIKGHTEYKRRFRGDEEKLYVASRGFNPLRLMAVISLCGIA